MAAAPGRTRPILVTGALGQIGTELVPALRLRYGDETVIASDLRMLPAGAPAAEPHEHLDCADLRQLAELVRRYDVGTIYHLAALLSAAAEAKPQVAWSLNMGSLYNVLEVARQYRCRVFFPSSIGAFDPTTPPVRTPQVTIQRPTTIYGITKVAGELLCDYYANRFGVDTRGLRLPGLISHAAPPGGGTTDYAVEIFYQAVRYRHYTCFLAAETHLDMMYMPDAIRGMIALMEADGGRLRFRNAYNVTAMSVTPAEIADEIRKHIPPFAIDYHVDPVRQSIAESWPRSLDDTAARDDWGWSPEFDPDGDDKADARTGGLQDRHGASRLKKVLEPNMPTLRLERVFNERLEELGRSGRLKGEESVITGVVPARDGKGPRYLLQGHGDRPFLRMNSNGYLGLALNAKVKAAEEEAAGRCGTGPGAVRFISGTWEPHVALEQRLAAFHNRPAAMLFSSAYAAMMGVLPPLIGEHTAVISDALNHNCIINAIALGRPAEKRIYRHLDMEELERHLAEVSRSCSRAIIVTDGVFSMRGDHAPLERIREIVDRFDPAFAENVLLIVDDSHGVGALGPTGRGTEEVTRAGAADLLVATLGKALGVNGGYVVGSDTVIRFLRETSPFYIYSNPITPAEAAAAIAAVAIVDGPDGHALLAHLHAMTDRFRRGLVGIGLETLAGAHPVVPLMVRDTERTSRIVRHLRDEGVLATGLNYPVVPRGDEEIRFQITADHTAADVDEALGILRHLPQ